jgi:hypothetical protein
MNDATRPEALPELRVLRIVLVLRLLLGVQVIEVAEELVKPVRRGQMLVPVAKMVLAELTRGVAVRLEEPRDRRVLGLGAGFSPGQPHLAQARAKHALSENERRSSGRAGLLTVVIGEHHPIPGDAVDVGRAVAHETERVGADVRLPDVVAPDHEDVRLVLREQGRWQPEHGGDGCHQQGPRRSDSHTHLILRSTCLVRPCLEPTCPGSPAANRLPLRQGVSIDILARRPKPS